MQSNKRGDIELKDIVKWILVAAIAILMWITINEIIRKLLVLY